MYVQLLSRSPTRIAYLHHTGPYGCGITNFWTEMVSPWMVENNLMNRPRYGISHDDPNITAPEHCRYDAGVEVPKGFICTGSAQSTELPGGRYAVLRFEDTLENIDGAWIALLRD